jgi:single-strand DNA-binding protein
MATNVVVLEGNLTKEPEVKQVGESKVAKFGLAVNRRMKDKDEVDFFDVEIWGKSADFVEEYVTKGSNVTVVGEARQDTWQDKEGKNRSKVFFRANSVQLHGKKDSDKAPKAKAEDKTEAVPF